MSNSNAQGEYYLTDIVEILKNSGHKVEAFPGAEFEELQGIILSKDLQKAEAYFKSIVSKTIDLNKIWK